VKYDIGLVVRRLLTNMHFFKTDAVKVMFYLWAQMKFFLSVLYIFNPIWIKFNSRHAHKKIFRDLEFRENFRTGTHAALGRLN